VEERDGRFLMIWREAPHWMVADEEVHSLVLLSDGSRSLEELVESIAERGGSSTDELRSNIRTVMGQLERAGVAYRKRPKERAISHRPVLENITINVTRRCNLKCAHCFLDTPEGTVETLRTEDVERFLREGKRYLAKNINFSLLGGEPLLEVEKTLELAELVKKWGGEAVVSTNGLLVDDRFARRAKELDLLVQVSLEGSTPEVNDRIRGRGSFERARKGVETLVGNGTYTILSMVVQRSNVSDMEEFYTFSERIGADEVRFIPLNIMGRALSNELRPISNVELVHAVQDLLGKHPAARDRMKRDFLTVLKTVCSLSSKRLYCGTGLKTIMIDADGETYPCPNHQLPEFRCGNVKDHSFKDIWLASPVLQKVRTTYQLDGLNDECPVCPVKYWCMGGCRGETYHNTGDMRSVSIRCEELREAVLETLWILGSEGGPVEETERLEYF
jgi:radical SAM protein with 4Fe4S-binding SPASM domain